MGGSAGSGGSSGGPVRFSRRLLPHYGRSGAGRPKRTGFERDDVEAIFEYEGWREYGRLAAPAKIAKLPNAWVRRTTRIVVLDKLDPKLLERP